ncbi:hypothetical protein OGAPHI_003364 [Ogataea philodendri]|uniref:Uncharacterized protein n=1 Tax=Ogataea philodendri TaxID=1378263 RepID=A0A9P8P923_9ASCO|nr:uncharacterized protein OGAPHI_003364 [Ogataea philodendri]KAH3666914.1 hypothetical protein OGAPHI_003364 [Ogataea philodendri]
MIVFGNRSEVGNEYSPFEEGVFALGVVPVVVEIGSSKRSESVRLGIEPLVLSMPPVLSANSSILGDPWNWSKTSPGSTLGLYAPIRRGF